MRGWGGASGQDRKFPGWSLCEERVTFVSSLYSPCSFLSSQPCLCVCVHLSVTASALNSLVAEETIKVPEEQAAEILFIAAVGC